ncbi:MAG TPA: hypothetical protein VM096_07475 [Vicinamibacterales bacterium]|nr:hypothetical protein [Vicinamibacterales bacterium]
MAAQIALCGDFGGRVFAFITHRPDRRQRLDNEVSGAIGDLPFDSRGRRLAHYRLAQGAAKAEARKVLGWQLDSGIESRFVEIVSERARGEIANYRSSFGSAFRATICVGCVPLDGIRR